MSGQGSRNSRGRGGWRNRQQDNHVEENVLYSHQSLSTQNINISENYDSWSNVNQQPSFHRPEVMQRQFGQRPRHSKKNRGPWNSRGGGKPKPSQTKVLHQDECATDSEEASLSDDSDHCSKLSSSKKLGQLRSEYETCAIYDNDSDCGSVSSSKSRSQRANKNVSHRESSRNVNKTVPPSEDKVALLRNLKADYMSVLQSINPTEIVRKYREDIHEQAEACLRKHEKKIAAVSTNIENTNGRSKLVWKEHRTIITSLQKNFEIFVTNVKSQLTDTYNLSTDIIDRRCSEIFEEFKKECKLFKKSFPIYAYKGEILSSVSQNQVTVISTDACYCASVAVPLFLQSLFKDGVIASCEPSVALTIAMAESCISVVDGSSTRVGYQATAHSSVQENAKLLFISDQELFNFSLKDSMFTPYSCIVFNCDIRRSVEADLLLEALKQCVAKRDTFKLVLILSQGVDASKFCKYFSASNGICSIKTTDLTLPVCTLWKKDKCSCNVDNYDEVVDTALAIHELNSSGDVLIFLPCVKDLMEVYLQLHAKFNEHDYRDVECVILHEDGTDQKNLSIAKKLDSCSRKFILATSWAEHILLPSVLYVIDTGVTKEHSYDPAKNVEVLKHSFISRTRAKIRKQFVGRYRSGICYRLYNKSNYARDMALHEIPDVARRSPFNIMVRMFQHRSNNAMEVDFIDPVPDTVKKSALSMLKSANAVNENQLTALGHQIVQLPFLPKYSKIIVLGIQWGYAFEAVILVAFFLVNKPIFLWNEIREQQKKCEAKRLQFLCHDSDTLTNLNVYSSWFENNYNEVWCSDNSVDFHVLHEVKAMVSEIIDIVRGSLKENIIPDLIAVKEVDCSALQELLFDCFKENLCIFSGHHRSGYFLLRSSCMTFLHPLSPVLEKVDLPQFLVFDDLHCTNRNYMTAVTSVQEKVVLAAIENGGICAKEPDFLKVKLQPFIIEPVGVAFIKNVLLGKNGEKLLEIEEEIRQKTTSDFVVIEPSEEKCNITVFTLPEHRDEAETIIRSIIKSQMQNVLSGEETRILELKRGEVKLPVGVTWKKGASVTNLEPSYMKSTNPSSELSDADASEDTSIKYNINVTWPRRRCKGYAFVSFNSKDFEKVRRLTMRTYIVGKLQLEMKVNRNFENQLYVWGLRPETNADELKLAVESLCANITVENVKIIYEKPFETSEEDFHMIEQQLVLACHGFIEESRFKVDLQKPKITDTIMSASISVSNAFFVEIGLGVLNNDFKVDEFAVKAFPEYSSVIHCNVDVFKALKQRIELELCRLEDDVMQIGDFSDHADNMFQFIVSADSLNGANFRLVSGNFDILTVLRGTVQSLLEGEKITSGEIDGLHKLFTHGGHLWLRTLEEAENIHIIEDYRSKVLRLYGLQDSCKRAVKRIKRYMCDVENEIVRVVDLSSWKNSRLLLKSVIQSYGIDLSVLIEQCHLRSAEVNIRSAKLVLHGCMESIEEAWDALDDLASTCSDVHVDLASTQELCCACSVPPDKLTLRLEHCGHLYCAECLRGLIERAKFPIQCCAEDCDKELITEDICKGLDYDDEQINKLLDSSLSEYIAKNAENFMYCPAPDCSMFLDKRKIQGDKWKCPLCRNDICIPCNVIFHDGYTCDMYQGSKKDPNYSYKVWLKEKNADSKQCPKCGTGIEKTAGCNHMTCWRCHAHFCWMCCTAFPTGSAVYDHMPFCKNYGK